MTLGIVLKPLIAIASMLLEKHLQWRCGQKQPVRRMAMVSLSTRKIPMKWRYGIKGANLTRANLSGANLAYAKFSRAKLQDANLEGANLEGTILEWANLQ